MDAAVASEQLEAIREWFHIPEGSSLPKAIREVLPQLVSIHQRFETMASDYGRLLEAVAQCSTSRKDCPCPAHRILEPK